MNIDTGAIDTKWEEIKTEIETAWGGVFKVVNTVISHHESFGYKLIENKINPSFHEILLSLKVMEAILDAIYAEVQDEYELSRMMLNAKQQINHIERVVTALKHQRQDDYEAAMALLRSQAQI